MTKKRVVKKIQMSRHSLRVEEGHDHKGVIVSRAFDYNWELNFTPDEAEAMAKALMKAAQATRKYTKTSAAKLMKEAKSLK